MLVEASPLTRQFLQCTNKIGIMYSNEIKNMNETQQNKMDYNSLTIIK